MIIFSLFTNRKRSFILVLITAFILINPFSIIATGNLNEAQHNKIQPNSPKIETKLEILSRAAQRKDATQLKTQAKSLGIKLKPHNKMDVIIEMEKGKSITLSDLAPLRGSILAKFNDLYKVTMPVAKITNLPSYIKGVDFIRSPYTPISLDGVQYGENLSEGTNLTGGGLLHSKGILGKDVKIAVIDVGFISLDYSERANEIPPESIAEEKDYTGNGLKTGHWHGTVVAEIVHDMAPKSDLYLKKVNDEVALGNAVQDAIRQDIDIIVHSVGWVNTNFGDGSGVIANIAKKATDNGILWVNAAGNAARRHWEGVAKDKDGDGWLEFENGKETLSINVDSTLPIQAFLTWNDWPESDKDFDLYLVNKSGNILNSSRNNQTGSQPPAEGIQNSAYPDGTYLLKVSVPDNYHNIGVEIFTFNYQLDPFVERSSVMSPGNVQEVFTVGAINKNDWQKGPIEYFSSRGPTSDERTKPDITGPDGVTTYLVGTFTGTSAAAPYVAGAAGLILSRTPDLEMNQIKKALIENAQDLGEKGVDNVYGEGKMRLFYKTPSATRSIEVLDGDEIEPGQKLRIKLRTNMPTTLQGGLRLEENVPEQFEVLNINSPDSATTSGNLITNKWDLVSPGGTRELTYEVLVPQDTPAGEYTFDGYINGNSISGVTTATVLGHSEPDENSDRLSLDHIEIGENRVSDGLKLEVVGENVDQIKVVVYSPSSGKEIFNSEWVKGVNFQWGYYDNDGQVVPNGIYLIHVQVMGNKGEIKSGGLEKVLVLR